MQAAHVHGGEEEGLYGVSGGLVWKCEYGIRGNGGFRGRARNIVSRRHPVLITAPGSPSIVFHQGNSKLVRIFHKSGSVSET